MINSVRNTVLAIINKNNYGYISPGDFNLFAKQAQLDIFDEYFIRYNQQINEENAIRHFVAFCHDRPLPYPRRRADLLQRRAERGVRLQPGLCLRR